LESGDSLHVDEVLYVPGLKKNLLSVATLEDKGYCVIFKDMKEPLGKKGVFVGYSENSKAYMIYVPGQRKIEVSREITFHEEAAFNKCRVLQ
jgi:hypothetical protein